ncbi:hypothetical protein [Flavobacterium sp. DG2-3]|uniref:hypothetical protein n=1 Tax=Flavobacterium sp. DG2-3 TaxID=3068317 RepID=UPI00273E38C7|nr:hypothetical protein [Flavobacterium sp. DG2-3]MDP5199812.1 hypothetical protein [Flavobacterium sp. DG2-3]
MKKRLLIIVNLIIAFYGHAQFSVIQDGEGETSFQVFQASTLLINAEKESIGFSFSPKEFVNGSNQKYWIITLSANAKDGTSNLFKGGEFQFSGKLGGNLVFDVTDYGKGATGNLVSHFVGLEALYSRNNVFDISKPFEDQISEQTNLGFRLNYGLNLQNVAYDKLKFLGAFTLGISGSVGLKDNSDILDEMEIITSEQIITNGSTTRTVSETSKVYLADEVERNQMFARLNFDFGKYIISKRFFSNLHMTYAFDENYKPSFNPALGLYVTAKGAPIEAIVGLQVQTKDWTNNRNSEKDRWERTSIVLTAGFPFN